MATAILTPENTPEEKLVRAEGRNVLRVGDSITVWMEATSRKQRRVEIKTVLMKSRCRFCLSFRICRRVAQRSWPYRA